MYGTFVRGVRQSRRLSQRELAGISGISQANISAIENDRRVPSADTLNRLLVSCGYELAAAAGQHIIACPRPSSGSLSDDVPPRLPDDPPDERPAVHAPAGTAARARIIADMLDAVGAVTSPR